MSEEIIIELRSIKKHYDDVLAVNDISLEVRRGELLVLLGSSGCGKTTTLRLIAGLERPNTGEVILNGQMVAGQNAWIPPENRHLGMVFQDYALFPHMTVYDNITFPLQGMNNLQRRDRVQDMLKLVGMSGMSERYPHQLSGGQQQRIALARALASEPSVVLLDEPFSNLDAARRKQVREEVRQILQLAGATGIFVTHDQEEAMSIADTIAVMQAGKILQIDTPSELYRQPKHPDVAAFLGDLNYLQSEADGNTITTAIGTIPLTKPKRGTVDVYVRPESIALQQKASAHNATVLETRFYGHYQIVTVEISDDTLLDVRVWAHDTYLVGDNVNASIVGDVILFD
ncbi:MAG: ABC transporter ATP-binding protein [Chloroflexota bacterium]